MSTARDDMFRSIPIIGIAGGIGSGKSFVANLFIGFGCVVISSDDQVRAVYQTEPVKETLRQWWGDSVFKTGGEVNRRAVADRVFADSAERQRLEELLHPSVEASRLRRMDEASLEVLKPVAFVWDSPLLFETGTATHCDAMIFIDATRPVRLARVAATRGWSESELRRREILQMPLDNKRRMSNYSLVNTADADSVCDQIRQLLPRIIEATQMSK